ncbi:MAG: hypothetical protein R3270_07905 [Gammaproteobacteria bacterium]|nr:hypothetical protein [Gammaproteobacteria bacterium]
MKRFMLIVIVVLIAVGGWLVLERDHDVPQVDASKLQAEMQQLEAMLRENSDKIDIQSIDLQQSLSPSEMDILSETKCTVTAKIDDGRSTISVSADECKAAVEKLKAMLPGAQPEK